MNFQQTKLDSRICQRQRHPLIEMELTGSLVDVYVILCRFRVEVRIIDVSSGDKICRLICQERQQCNL